MDAFIKSKPVRLTIGVIINIAGIAIAASQFLDTQ